MAAKQTVALDVQLNGEQATTTVKSIKQQLKEANQELVMAAENFGTTSKEAINAAKKVAGLKDAIGDARDMADAFNPDAKFKAFGQVLQGVTGGFAGLQGAMALFGNESEDLQKTLVKVQSAMALSEGLNSVMGSIDAFKNLGAVIKSNVIGAFTTLRGALIATGIGALAVGLGLVIANFEKVKEVLNKIFPGLAEFAGKVMDLVQGFTDLVGITSAAERAQESYSNQIKKSNQDIGNQIEILEALGGQEKKIFELKKQQAVNELRDFYMKTQGKKKLTDEELKQRDEASQKITLLTIQERNFEKSELEKSAKERKDAHDKQVADEKAKSEKLLAERKRLADLSREIEDGINKFTKSEYERTLIDIQRNLDRRLEASKGNAALILEAERLAAFERRDADIKEAKRRAEEAAAEQQQTQAQGQLKIDATKLVSREVMGIVDIQTQFQKTAAEDLAKSEAAAAELRKQQFEMVGNAFSALSEVVGQQTAAGKAIAVAQATMNTYQAATEALKANYGIFGPAAQVARIVTVAAVIAKGIAAVKKIVAVQVPKGGGGGGSAAVSSATAALSSIQAPIRPEAQTTMLNQASINQIGNAAAPRAYVLESEGSSAQERITRINRAARIN